MGGHGRYAEAGADLKAGASGKSYHPVGGEVGVFLCGAGGPLVAREIYPDPIPDGKVCDPFPEGVDDTSTVLVGSYLRERRRCTAAGAKAGLPVGGVDAGDDHADSDFAWTWFGHVAIDEPENRWVTGM